MRFNKRDTLRGAIQRDQFDQEAQPTMGAAHNLLLQTRKPRQGGLS
jgi:hypothetical protein